MKQVLAAAVLGLLAAAPAWAQQQQFYPTQYPPPPQLSQLPGQAVEPALVADIQRQLQAQGLYAGAVDGSFGPDTRQALAEWQRRQGYPVTGLVDSNAIAGLGVVPQQAQIPEDEGETGEIKNFRDEFMTSPNVYGEETQGSVTGIPTPAHEVPAD